MSDKIKVVCIGGGSGLSHFIKGIKDIENIELKCIVSVADNGGSSGILKEELNIPAVGDLRNVLTSLANVPEDFTLLMDYRFNQGSLRGHSLGNLMIAALTQLNDNNIISAIRKLSNIFNIRGEIIPATKEVVDIKAILVDEREIYGEKNIGVIGHRINKLEYCSDVKANNHAVRALLNADYIIYSIGSLYTSLMPSLIIPEIKQAIKKSDAKKIYFANLMSQPGETDNYTLSEHIDAINNHLGFNGIDFVIINNRQISKKVLDKYQKKGAYPIKYDCEKVSKHVKIIEYDIAKVKNGLLMHSPEKIECLFKDDLDVFFKRSKIRVMSKSN